MSLSAPAVPESKDNMKRLLILIPIFVLFGVIGYATFEHPVRIQAYSSLAEFPPRPGDTQRTANMLAESLTSHCGGWHCVVVNQGDDWDVRLW